MKEKLQEYALIAEIVGGVAIVASLIFVGLQVQQNAEQTALNTRQMQTDAYTQLMLNIVENNRWAVDHPELQIAAAKGGAGEPLTESEGRLYRTRVRNVSRFAELAWNQYENGIISEENLLSAIAPFLNGYVYEVAFKDTWESSVYRNRRLVDYLESLPKIGTPAFEEYRDKVEKLTN